ncbi:MAG: hypothetical protein PVI31_03520 [Gemmatimonadota bacterium]|jgi:hypothetical protein
MSAPTHTASEVQPRRAHTAHDSESTADLLFDIFFAGGVGGSATALFFLVVDGVLGRLFFTPSAIGTALFTGEAVSAATPVRLDMVVYFSIVHFALFGTVAFAAAELTRWRPDLERRPLLMAGIIFAVLTAGVFLANAFVLHGVLSAIGIVPVIAANAVTGVAMAVFFRWSRTQRI